MGEAARRKAAGETQPFRIAIRAEGDFINAYLAKPHTMEDARLLGSISRGLCEMDRSIFDEFAALMQRGAAGLCMSALGVAPIRFDSTPAPEHEKAGRA